MIYLDNNATTQLDERVLKEIVEELSGPPANPSSMHALGKRAKKLLNKARERAASFFKVKEEEIIFTSSATEALNTVIRGHLQETRRKGKILSTKIEHASIFNILLELQKKGEEVEFLPVHSSGAISPWEVENALQKETKLIILSAVNSETGVKTDIEKIGKIAEAHEVPLIVDGVAKLGKELFSIPQGISAICFSGHKIHASKGVGMIVYRHPFKFAPLLVGGGQERGKRGGTENLSAIIGMGCALELITKELPDASNKMKGLRDSFEAELKAKLPNIVQVNGSCERICNTSNLAFLGIDGESLLIALDLQGLYASAGSACSAGAFEPSRILLNMGIEPKVAKSSLRFSLSRFTSADEISTAIKIIVDSVKKL